MLGKNIKGYGMNKLDCLNCGRRVEKDRDILCPQCEKSFAIDDSGQVVDRESLERELRLTIIKQTIGGY